MNSFVRLRAAALALLLILSVFPGPVRAEEPQTSLTVLFTHDTHDHFYPDAADRGGYVRLATALKEARAAAGDTPTVTLDAGDFSMGSLFQTVYTTDAPELRALGAMGYDVTTLGNHEFDYRQQGLADMLNAAMGARNYVVENGVSRQVPVSLPAIVQANYTTPKNPEDPAAQALTAAFEAYPVTPYVILDKGGIRVAVFGVMGVDSDECAPMSNIVLEPVADAAKRLVAEIREKENPTFIICLSHTGTEDGKGEDYELAKAVEGIDLIISGHTHTVLPEPIEVNGTLIVSCGPYTQNLGSITLTSDGGFSSYSLTPLDNSVPTDPDMAAMASEFKTQVDGKYLSGYELGYDEVLASSQTDFTTAQTGDLIGRAYIDTVKEIEGDSYVPIAFAVAPDGVIRDRIRSGNVTTANAFDILSLGSGSNGSPGYPLVSVYLTGKDLKNAFEVDASVSQLMPAAELFGAGCWWEYNPHRMILDRVTGCGIMDVSTAPNEVPVPIEDGKPHQVARVGVSIEDDRLYRVVADLYSGQMLGAVESKSFGILTVTPRDESGTPVTDLESLIIHDGEGREVKAWYALANYLKEQKQIVPSFPGKTEKASWNPIRLLFPMGLPTLMVLLVGLALPALIVFLIYRIATRKRRRSRQGYRPYRG